jgi:hypothetical protein
MDNFAMTGEKYPKKNTIEKCVNDTKYVSCLLKIL